MKVVKDYFGHEIHKGDVVLYSEKGSCGYRIRHQRKDGFR